MKRLVHLFGMLGVCATLGCGGAAPLPAPTALTLSPLGAGIHVTWTRNSTDESEFQIERKSGSADYAKLTSVPFATTVYHDEPVTSGTTYFYRVRATAGDRISGYSNEANMKAP